MDIAIILSRKFADSEWTLDGDSYEGLSWLSDTPKPTEEELEELWPAAQEAQQAEQDAKAAARQSALAKLAALGLTEEEIGAL